MARIIYAAILATALALVQSVSGCADETRSDNGRSLYTNDGIRIQGKDIGLSPENRRVYIMEFADYLSTNADGLNRYRLESHLRKNLSDLGVSLVNKIQFARAVVEGSIDSLTAVPGDNITNLSGSLLYTLSLTYSVIDKDRNYIQRDRPIREQVLVLDTNTWLSNYVVEVLLTNIARHTAEGIYYGWQLEYSRTEKGIFTLGGTNETNNASNGAQ